MRRTGQGSLWVVGMTTVLALGCPAEDPISGDTITGTDVATEVAADTATETATDTATEVSTSTGACLECLKPGVAMRFTSLDVKEPSEPAELPQFLNDIWGPDITASRLNIVMRIDKVTDNGDKTYDIDVTGGSAWHDLDIAQVQAQNSTVVPNQYHFLTGATSTFTLRMNDKCEFESLGNAALEFHPGPVGHALVCSAGYEAMNLGRDKIPLSRLEASGRFNDTCTAVEAGSLQGCIASEAACRICNLATAPNYDLWALTPNTSKPDTPCSTDYCEHNCGKNIWVNFGAFVKAIDVPMGCNWNNDGGANNGYMIAGDWGATAVPFGEAPAAP